MPIYEYDCKCGNGFEVYLSVSDYMKPQRCNLCGETATKVLRTPPIGFVQKDVCYDSPIDGRPITSMAARREDLARSGCIEYDPEMRKDYQSRMADSEKKLESSVDNLLEKEIAAMPSRKREKLTAELQGGATADVVRKTV